MRAIALSWVLVVLAAGCSEEPTEVPDSGISVKEDAGELPPDSGVKMVVFEAEEGTGPRLEFGAGVLLQDELQLDLVAHELTDVYGLAFRIEYDPAVLELLALERSPAFTHEQLFRAKLARPGLVVVAASAVGPATGIALDGVAIAHLTLRRVTPALTEIRIVRPFGMTAVGGELHYGIGTGAILERTAP